MSPEKKRTHDPNEPHNILPDLPPKINLESPAILKATIKANRLLGELKGYCQTLPDPRLLINTVILQESKDSSAIENIVTTQDELYQAVVSAEELHNISSSTKEVIRYREAMYLGLEKMKSKSLLTTNTMIQIMQQLKGTSEEVRKNSGTRLANPITKKIIYTPPEGEELIRKKLFSLERFIHDDKNELDPLIKMALIHYQFEAIHPFSDGNGRTGRILNVLYLVQQQLLTLPVLYLSSYIINHKTDYYRLLREVTENQNWEDWILYMLNAIAETSQVTLQKIDAIQKLKEETFVKVKDILKASFNRDLVDVNFSFPYVKIKTLEAHKIAKRQTASTYLQELAKAGILHPMKIRKEIYYINVKLMDIISK
ncbi:MAG: Fic family protein [Ferruginibacter sp.]